MRARRRLAGIAGIGPFLAMLALSRFGLAQAALTLEDVLREARASNVRLPIPSIEISVAREKVSEARAERWLRVALEGDFVYAPGNGYDPAITNLGEFRAQAVARQPLYDGGARRAAVERSEADLDVAGARYRLAAKDLELEVRNRYSEWVQSDSEAAARREGIERLRRYRTSLESRRASGQGVAADLLKIEVRLATEQAAVVDAEGRREAARIALNSLMGRDTSADLVLAPMPPPEAPPSRQAANAADSAPEVAEASAQTRAAGADLATAEAERKPHLNLSADVGFLGSDTTRLVPRELLAADPNATFGDRLRRDAGYSFTLSFTWPVWDAGAIRSRIRQAELRLEAARRNVTLQKREAERQWAQAQATLRSTWEQIRILSGASPSARDSWLEAESRYRGGAATALEVLDAYAASVDAAVRLSEALSRYRIAEALAMRWGMP